MELHMESAKRSESSAAVLNMSGIDRREKLSYKEFLSEYEKPLRPVIITDALKNWKALSKWTPEFFQSRYPSKVVRFKKSEYKMDDFINRVLRSSEKEPVPYMRNVCISEEYPELFEDISPDPVYFLPNWLNAHFISKRLNELLHRGAAHELYIGGAGMRFPVLHCDGYHTHAFICHIYGSKEFIAFSPDQTPFMYPVKGEETVCPIEDVEKPDLVKYPLFAKATPIRFRLEPGETLFIPSGWWHTAKTLSPAISVSVNVANASNWTTLTRDLCHLSHNLLLAIPLAAYLTFFRLYKSVTD
jgi:hypothetical protein